MPESTLRYLVCRGYGAVVKTFFKKHSPSQAIIFSDGSSFRAFELVNHEIGILATEDPRIIREIEACIAGQRGGAEKITGEEYLSLQSQKKSNLSATQWREEWQPRKLPPTASGASLSPQAAVAAEPPVAPRVLPPADGEKSFKPKTSKK